VTKGGQKLTSNRPVVARPHGGENPISISRSVSKKTKGRATVFLINLKGRKKERRGSAHKWSDVETLNVDGERAGEANRRGAKSGERKKRE